MAFGSLLVRETRCAGLRFEDDTDNAYVGDDEDSVGATATAHPDDDFGALADAVDDGDQLSATVAAAAHCW